MSVIEAAFWAFAAVAGAAIGNAVLWLLLCGAWVGARRLARYLRGLR